MAVVLEEGMKFGVQGLQSGFRYHGQSKFQ